ncbi:MAG TPA: ABC transporter permease [Oligoflexia bacterium]|nr:ABC transporter permease [Oligoflexia bacterium]
MKAEFAKKFLRNRAGVAGLLFIIFVCTCATFAPWIATHSYEEQNIDQRLSSPNAEYWMGSDSLGRDLYSRIVYGARTSMAVGIITALVAVFIGTFYGALSGYFGGWVDAFLMRVVDIFYIFPSLLLAILIMVVWGQGLVGIIAALSIVGWVAQARLVRGQVLQVKEMLHVENARALGVPPIRLLWRHVLPLIWGPVIVQITFQIPANIMAESFLSFIGLGIQPPLSSWGTLANEGWRGMRSYPHLIIFPGAVLFLTMLAFQFFGDGLRDWLDPYQTNK